MNWCLLVVGLAVGTYALRLLGVLAARLGPPSERLTRLFEIAPVVLLVSVGGLAALNGESAGSQISPARWLGVATAGWLVWRQHTMLVTVLVAAGVTAGLRVLGLA